MRRALTASASAPISPTLHTTHAFGLMRRCATRSRQAAQVAMVEPDAHGSSYCDMAENKKAGFGGGTCYEQARAGAARDERGA